MALLYSTMASLCNCKIALVLFSISVAFPIQAESAPRSKRSLEEKSNLKCSCLVTEPVMVSYFIWYNTYTPRTNTHKKTCISNKTIHYCSMLNCNWFSQMPCCMPFAAWHYWLQQLQLYRGPAKNFGRICCSIHCATWKPSWLIGEQRHP